MFKIAAEKDSSNYIFNYLELLITELANPHQSFIKLNKSLKNVRI